MVAYVYILECGNGSYYTGTTRASLERRLDEHNSGSYGGYTSSRRPVKLVYSEAFANIADAITAERQIKGWSRKKKRALIDGDFRRLKILSRRRVK